MSENLSPISLLTLLLPYLVLSYHSPATLSPNQINIEASPLRLECGSLGAGGEEGLVPVFPLEWFLVKFLLLYCLIEYVHCLSKILQTLKIIDNLPNLDPMFVIPKWLFVG